MQNKPVIVQMFEELTDNRCIMVISRPNGSSQIETQDGERFVVRQVGHNLEVVKCATT